MKTSTKGAYFVPLILFGLILALPFTPLRKSLGTSINTLTEVVYVKAGVKDFKNKQIAQVISNTLQINEIGDFRNEKLANKAGINSHYGTEVPINYVMSSQKMQTSDFGVYGNSGNASGNFSQANGAIAFSNGSNFQNNKLSAKSVNNSGTIGISSAVSSASSATSKTAVKQSAGGPPPDNGGDPAPPIGSLPISDATIFMLLLALVFVLKKTYKVSVI